jgi:hypothetical protein
MMLALLRLIITGITSLGPRIAALLRPVLAPLLAVFPALKPLISRIGDLARDLGLIVAGGVLGGLTLDILEKTSERSLEVLEQIKDRLDSFHADVRAKLGLAVAPPDGSSVAEPSGVSPSIEQVKGATRVLDDILAELQAIGICACDEGEDGGGASPGSQTQPNGVTRLSNFIPADDAAALEDMAALAEAHMAMVDAAIQKTTAKVSDAVLTQKDIVLGAIADTATDVAPIIQGLDNDLSQIFVNASRDGKITADEIANAFQEMALRIIQTQVFDKLFGAAGPLGEIAGNLLGGLFGFAGGGDVGANIPIIVGERGAEVFIPKVNGTIRNNQNSQGMLAGASPVININQTVRFDTAVHNDMTAHILAALPAIKNVAADEVMNRLKGIRYR